jgi:hypothetical protein
MRSEICDGKIEKDRITFAAYDAEDGRINEEKNSIIALFKALAASHKDLEFEMKLCVLDDMGDFVHVKKFSFKTGICINEELCNDKKEMFSHIEEINPGEFLQPMYRYSRRLDIEFAENQPRADVPAGGIVSKNTDTLGKLYRKRKALDKQIVNTEKKLLAEVKSAVKAKAAMATKKTAPVKVKPVRKRRQ